MNPDSNPDSGTDKLAPTAKIDVSASSVSPGDRVVLDGRGSSSKTNSSLLCNWAIILQPDASQTQIEDDSAELTSFIADVEGDYQIELIVRDGRMTDRATITITAAGSGTAKVTPKNPDSAGDVDRALVEQAFRQVTGRDMTDSDFSKIKDKTVKRTIRKALKLTDAKLHWLQGELGTLNLVGADKPSKLYLKQIAKQLNKPEEFTVRHAFAELAISPKFNLKHGDAKSYTIALFEGFLGRKPSGTERSACSKMYDGKEGKLFGQKGRGQEEIVMILVSQPEFTKNFIRRSYKRYKGKDPSDRVLDSYVKRYQEAPEDYFSLVERWVTPKAPKK